MQNNHSYQQVIDTIILLLTNFNMKSYNSNSMIMLNPLFIILHNKLT
jgi:hypothetical protein